MSNRDVILLMDAMAAAERHSRMFNTSSYVTAVEQDPMQTTKAVHEIAETLECVVEVLDADRTNLNDLNHPSPLRDKVEATRNNGWRTIFVLRGSRVLTNDRRLSILASMIGSRAKLVLAVPGDPSPVPDQVVCDLREKGQRG